MPFLTCESCSSRGYGVYKDRFILDYDSHLTQKEYQNTEVDPAVLQDFIKDVLTVRLEKCIVDAANKGSYPTFTLTLRQLGLSCW